MAPPRPLLWAAKSADRAGSCPRRDDRLVRSARSALDALLVRRSLRGGHLEACLPRCSTEGERPPQARASPLDDSIRPIVRNGGARQHHRPDICSLLTPACRLVRSRHPAAELIIKALGRREHLRAALRPPKSRAGTVGTFAVELTGVRSYPATAVCRWAAAADGGGAAGRRDLLRRLRAATRRASRGTGSVGELDT